MAIYDTTFTAIAAVDQRTAELLELAATEGITLPLSIDLILWLEDRGHVVDLHTGRASLPHVGEPTATGIAISHLLTPEVATDEIDAYTAGCIDAEKGEPCEPLAHYSRLGDIEQYICGHKDATAAIEEALDYEEDMADRAYHASGNW